MSDVPPRPAEAHPAETQRDALRDSLVDRARQDADVIAAAILGSGATGQQDRWSDLDLALRLRPGVDQDRVIDRWTRLIFAEHGAVHRLDVHASGALYRVFLLDTSLQLDLSFWPAEEFRRSRIRNGGSGWPGCTDCMAREVAEHDQQLAHRVEPVLRRLGEDA